MNEVFEHIWNELQAFEFRRQMGARPLVMIAQDTWRYMTLDPMFPYVVCLRERRIFDVPYELTPPGRHYDIRVSSRFRMADYQVSDFFLLRN